MRPTLPPSDQNVTLAPHVMILGAGASIAAYKHWGAVGPSLPSMYDLIDVLSLRPILEGKGFDVEAANFEAFYDDLVSAGNDTALQAQIEGRVTEYFSARELPNQATLYDYLILGLRSKDLIASFNWDPFLLQAYLRHENVARNQRPRIAFLHGNVAIGSCTTDNVAGLNGQRCSKCGKLLQPTKLLYPVKKKDYSKDPFIKGEWAALRAYLEDAYYLTIFGYGAPKTDVEARALMLEVWNKNPSLELAEVEVIDVKSRDEIEESWREFFFSHHYVTPDSLEGSELWNFPRRSCDAFASATLMCDPWRDNPFPRFDSLEKLQNWVAPLLEEERAYEEKKEPFSAKPLAPNTQSSA